MRCLRGRSAALLFNDERYHRCNMRPPQWFFRYDHLEHTRVVGTIGGVVHDGVLDCGYSAPFGGIDFTRPVERVGAIAELLHSARRIARAEGIDGIRIRCRPAYFGVNEQAVEFALFNAGAEVESWELTLGIETWRFSNPDAYVAGLDGAARNKLRQALRAGMELARATTEDHWARCYDLLVEARHRRGATLKISLEYVKRLRELFGDRIAMYQVVQGDDLAGAALVYRISPDWDYVVAWGDDLHYRSSRVVNLLAYGLVCAALTARVSILDLGISSVDGIPDDGLIEFKRSIGATTGQRINLLLPTA